MGSGPVGPKADASLFVGGLNPAMAVARSVVLLMLVSALRPLGGGACWLVGRLLWLQGQNLVPNTSVLGWVLGPLVDISRDDCELKGS